MNTLFFPAALQAKSEAPKVVTLGDYIQQGGLIGHVILLAGLACIALTIIHFWRLRKAAVCPGDLFESLKKKMDARQYKEAREECKNNPSDLSRVLARGLDEREYYLGDHAFKPDTAPGLQEREYEIYQIIEPAVYDELEQCGRRMERRIYTMDFLVAVAPLLGLFGTVSGMIQSFQVIAYTVGKTDPAQLAGGISTALVTTFEGLLVAIPFLFVVGWYRKRVEELIEDCRSKVERLMRTLHSKGT